MKKFKLGLVLLILAAMGGAALQAAIPSTQREALVALYNATNGDSWTNSTNWKAGTLEPDGFGPIGSENTWFGVTTDPGNTYVTALSLPSNNLVGTIPAALGGLSNLQTLNLSVNQLDGAIPSELGNVTSLLTIRLNNNLLDSIPGTFSQLTTTREVYLASNQFTGNIPTLFGSLPGLLLLDLSNNQFDGAIPPQLGSLPNLQELDLFHNALSGLIPTELGSLTKLVTLKLYQNSLTGSIPSSFSGMTALRYLSLHTNHLSGAIPGTLGGLSVLQQFYVQGNMLEGPIPTALTGLTGLLAGGVDIGYNLLYTSDPTLITFLNTKDPDWAASQTIAPSGVTATVRDGGVIRIGWTTIPYTGGGGYYQVFSSTTQGSGYTPAGQTATKTTSSLDVSGLTVGQQYYFVVLTHTNVHAGNQNALDSPYSSEVTAIARTQAQVRITGTVTVGGTTPLPNVVMNGLPGNPVTNASGVYDVTVAAGWGETVTPALIGYTFAPPTRDYDEVIADQIDQDYSATLVNYTISGTVLSGGNGLANVVMTGLPSNPQTDATGFYTATVGHGFSATVIPTKTGYNFSPASIVYSSVGSDQPDQNYTATLKEYTLTVNATNGTVTRAPDQGTYTHGAVVELTPVPAADYRFVNWSGDATGTDNPLSVTMTGNMTITANFALVSRMITGTITRSIGGGLAGVVLSGFPESVVTDGSGLYTAYVDNGFSGTVTPTKAGYTFDPASRTYTNVTSDMSGQVYTATAIAYTLAVGGTNGSVTKSPDQATYEYGTPVDLTPVPDTGYHFVNWEGDASGTANPLTVIVDANKSITAVFAIDTLTISGTITAGGIGLADVVMTGLPGTTTTNASGFYTATVDYGFSATVTPTLADYAFTPASTLYEDLDESATQDYTATKAISLVERQALIALYEDTNGGSWTNSTNWKVAPLEADGFSKRGTENTWYGITVDPDHAYVRSISLTHNNLDGTIPTELGNLTGIETLLLYVNQLDGTIPHELGNLIYLTTFSLHTNQLDGPIPSEIGNLTALNYLRLNNNLLDSIPSSFSQLTNLRELFMANNQFTGNIPAWFGGLTNLLLLDLSNNLFDGPIPSELGNLANLQDLNLGRNSLSGPIPTGLGSLASLQYLRLHQNLLTGSIPTSFGGLTALKNLYLHTNRLSGAIPSNLAGLSDLQQLYVQGNMLEGSIPTSLTGLTALLAGGVDISYNMLYASDPTLIAFLTSKDPDWAASQTIAPSGVTATVRDGGVIRIGWTTIPYTGGVGYYAVYSSPTQGTGYTLAGQTANKTTSYYDVTGLTIGQPYYFVVLTHTDAHAGNPNALDSPFSLEVNAVPRETANIRITGTILLNGNPLPNVVMSGFTGDPVTNASGVYDVTVDAGWGGTITPTLAGYSFVPATREYTEVTTDQTGQDYTASDSRPTVVSITSITPDGAYMAGSTIPIQVTFSEAVNVSGAPQLLLETGTTDTLAAYSSGSGTTTLIFNYLVLTGHTSADLDYVGTDSLTLNGGTIRDSAASDAILMLPAPGAAGSLGANKAIVIDTQAPSTPAAPDLQASSDTGSSNTDNITSNATPTFDITGLESGATVTLYRGLGNVIGTATVPTGQSSCTITPASPLTQGSHAITVRQTDLAGNSSVVSPEMAPYLTIDTSAPTVSTLSPADGATDVAADADLVLTFNENVLAGTGTFLIRKSSDNSIVESIPVTDARIVILGSQVTVNPTAAFDSQTGYYVQIAAGGFQDTAGNPYAGIEINVDTTTWNFATVDNTAPTVVGISSNTADGAYKAGSAIDIRVTFSEVVEVTGTPQITLETGTSDAVVAYSAGSGSTVLVFNYTVAAGHASADLDYVGIDSLALNGGTIKDAADNPATLMLPAPGAAGSLGANKALVIDTEAPAAPNAPDLQASSDTGTLNTDNVTDNTTPTFDIGGVETGATVTLTCQVIGGGAPVVVQAVAGGSSCAITVTPPLSQGVYTITARQTDLAGNVSAVSSAMAPNLYIAAAPSVTTQAATDVASSTATGNGTIVALGLPNPTAHGFVWNTTGSPTLSDSFTNEGSASSAGAFTSAITGLNPNVPYYIRAYATNSLLTVYGNEVSFSTLVTYTLTYAAGANGSITGVSPQTVDHGGSGTAVTAVPDGNYHFVDWSDASTVNPRTDTNVQANLAVTANFAINTYTLTYTAGANGSITGTTPQTVAHGSDGTAVTAVANAGYHFVNWSDASTVNPRTDTNVTANLSVTANFAVNTYTLTYAAGANGSITGTTPQTVDHGGSGTAVTAVANAGYHFVDWSDASTVNPRTDTNVQANLSVTANFAVNTYTLTYAAGANGSITGTTPQTVDHGGSGTAVTAVPDANYHFVNWSDASTANPRTDTNVTANLSVTANFAVNTYTLTYTAGANGSITGTTPQTVAHGSDGTAVTAVANAGYHFVDWSDARTVNPRTDTNVQANLAVTANFAVNTYTLTYTAGANGSITGTTPQTVNHGSSGTEVTAVPNTGYHFVSWSDGVLTAARTDMNVTADITVTATFAINSYTLTYTAGANGTITGVPSQMVDHGGSGTEVTAVPNTGYHFVSWTDGLLTAARTDMNVTADITVTATFAINSYTLTYTAGENGTITGISPQTVDHGGSGTAVTAVPNIGHHFVSWSDGVLTASRTDSNVTADLSVTATFSITTFTLTYTAGANGTITGISPQTIVHGGSGTEVTAVPNAGYHFVSWSDGVLTAARTDTNVTADITVTATFAINSYTLTYTAGADGTITGASPQTVAHGASGTLVTAVPNTGYHFVSWSDGVLTAARTDANVTSDITVTATFAITSYTLTYTAGANGTLTGASPQTVAHGASGTLVTAVPNTGYHFVSWSDGVLTAARTDTNVTSDITVTATFAITSYTLTYTAGENGTISGTSPQTVAHGASGTVVTAVPNTGYHFVSWSDGVLTAARTDTNVTADITVTATFAITSYTLTYTAGENGTISGTSPQTVAHGASGTVVTAVPNTEYHFVSWSDGVLTATRTDTNVTSDITVTATFAITSYTLTYTAGENGTITGISPQAVEHGGSGTQVTAVPNIGYHFVSWSDGVLTAARTDTNVTADITVMATFAITSYTLTYTAGANGTITGTTPQTVDHGANGTAVTAVPNANYHFVNWSDASTANPRTDLNVTANLSVTANFAIDTYTLTYTAGANGSITGTTPQTVNYGADGTAVTAVANAGYHFVDWSDASTVNPRTDTNVTANLAVTANFAVNTYTLTYTAGTNGTITGTTPQTVNHGASGTTVTAVPDTGYHFVSWSDGALTAARTDTNVTSDITVTATFAITSYTLTYTAGANGTITGVPSQMVDHGGSGTEVTAVPNTGYHFVSWTDGLLTAARTDMNVTADITVTATFAINSYTLTYTAGENGTITGISPQTVDHGGSGTAVTAVPNIGHHFVSWSDGVLTASRTDSNVTADLSVTATFSITTFTLTYTAGANGTITGISPQTIVHGGSGTEVTAVPNTGYHFVSWSDGVLTAARTDTNVTSDITVTATFAITSYTLTYTAGANGTISGTSPQTVAHGSSGTLVTAVPNTGYHFVNWSDGVLTAARTDTNVTSDITVTATFAITSYTLTYTAGANGAITGTSPQTVAHGASGSLVTAVPDTGYHFVSWSDGVLTAARTDTNVTSDITVTATFAITSYTLTYTAGTNGTITGISPQTVAHGASGSLVTAVPDTGYHFVSWSDGVLTAARTDANVTSDITVTATFAITSYTLTYTAGANGSITGISPQTVAHGASGTLVTAVPNTGYHFVSWSDGVLTAVRTDTNVTADITVTATFAITSYTLTYTAGTNGTITGMSPQTVAHGASGTLVTAVPNTGYHFVSWSDGVLTAARTDTNVTSDITVTATFAITSYTLTYTAGANGTITGTSPQTVAHGASGTLVTAVPNTGYHFVSWSDGVLTAARTDANVTSDVTVTATFAITSYTLTYTAGANGTITGTSPQTIAHGASGTLVTAVPNTGYHFVSWSDGVQTAARTDTNVTSDITVTATFAITSYTLTYTAGANGSITGVSPQTVAHGASGTLVTAVPDTGYHFVNWSDGVLTAARTDTNVTSDITVTANFAITSYMLAYTAGANGTITGVPSQMVDHGGSGTEVTAVPNTGYHFVSWTDGVLTAARTDTNVTADITVTATFAINSYTLTYTAGENGTIMGISPQTVTHDGSGTQVTAVPNIGHHFVSWSDGVLTASRTDSNVTADLSVTATFSITTFTLTYTAGANGTITGISPQTIVHGGSGTEVTAVPNAGYNFVSWSDGVLTAARTDTNVIADITVTASFALNAYTLTITSDHGTIVKVPDQATYDHGTPVEITATPAAGYAFVNWTGSVTSSENPLTLTMDGNKSLTANYSLNTYTISGTVTLEAAGLAGVTMAGLPGNPVTDGTGFYQATVSHGTSFTVTPTHVDYTFTPASRTYTGITGNQANQDYAATPIVVPTITVTSPNGGETWALGSAHDITWTQTGLTGSVTIDLYMGGVYQKTLGTPDAVAGTFSWTIGADETAGADYMIRAWQSGGVSDDSDADFALVRRFKVDFNKDGQEDLLWRCYGTGNRQGDNVVWFMTQTEGLSAMTLGGAQNTAGAMNLMTGSSPGKTHLNPMDVGNVRTSGPGKSYASPMDVGNPQTAGPIKTLASPLDAGNRGNTRRDKLTKNAEDSNGSLAQVNRLQTRTKDSNSDIVLQDAERLSAGDIRLMALDYSDAVLYNVLDTAWEIAGAGDFDGDGNSDVLWRYYGVGQGQGTTIIWYMNGTTITGQGYPYQVSDTDWRIDRTGDFNGDGKTDILWRYYGSAGGQGTAVIWCMDGANVIGQLYPPQVWDTDWKIEGIGDFDGDGRADLLWRYYGTGEGAGTTIIWYMNGTTIIGQDRPYLISDTDWRIDAVGDFDGDGKADIVWRYYGIGEGLGTTIIWYMDGATITGQDRPYRVQDLTWRIVNR